MSTITLEVSDETAARLRATPGAMEKVRAMIEAAFAAKPATDTLAALWGAIPDSAPVLAPEATTREAMYADQD